MNLGENLKDIILLDSDCNCTMFCKKKLVDKVFNNGYSIRVGTNKDKNLESSKKHTGLPFKKKY